MSPARSTLSAAHAAGAENDISVRPLHTLAHDFATTATRTRPAAARCAIDRSAVRAHHALAPHDALRLLHYGRRLNRLQRETGVGLRSREPHDKQDGRAGAEKNVPHHIHVPFGRGWRVTTAAALRGFLGSYGPLTATCARSRAAPYEHGFPLQRGRTLRWASSVRRRCTARPRTHRGHPPDTDTYRPQAPDGR